MRDRENRDVTVYDFLMRSNPDHAPKKPIVYFLDKIVALHNVADFSNTEKWDTKKEKVIYIRDIEIIEIDNQKKSICLLLYFADKKGMGASFTNMENHKQENIILEGDKARPESAHILISFEQNHGNGISYIGIVEDSSKLNRQKIQSYLCFLMKKIQSSSVTDFEALDEGGAREKDGKLKKYKFYNSIELQGHPSDNLMHYIENGKLTGIALESSDNSKFPVGDGKYVLPKRQELLLEPAKGKWSEDPISRLKEAINIGKQNNYETARVIFNSDDGKSHTARMDTETEGIVGDHFVKKLRLKGFSVILNEADDRINSEIKNQMISILKDTQRGGA